MGWNKHCMYTDLLLFGSPFLILFLLLSFIITPLPTSSNATTNANSRQHYLGVHWDSRNDSLGHHSYAEWDGTSSYVIVAHIPVGVVLLEAKVIELGYILSSDTFDYRIHLHIQGHYPWALVM